MPYYKGPDNTLYFLDSSQYEGLLPPGCVPISDEEAAAMQAPTTEARALEVRTSRDRYLSMLDRVSIRHRDQVDGGLPTTLTAEQYVEVLTLKQQLRDVAEQPGFPTDVTWPAKPEYLDDPDGDE